MSDYDRGAYTPQTDAPLAFDPRRPSDRRPMPMALIGSAIVLVLLLAGVAMVYRGGVRQAGESPRPVGAPVMAVKTAPPPEAAPASQPAMDVYNQGQNPGQPSPTAAATAASNTTGEVATLAPPPEQPAARPQPSAATVALLAKPSAPTRVVHPSTEVVEPARPAPAKVQVVKAEPRATPVKPAHLDAAELAAAGATRTTASTASAPVKLATATTRHAAPTVQALRSAAAADAAPTEAAPNQASPTEASGIKPAPATAAATSATGAAVVQIGAFSSTALADKGYADVAAAVPGRMSGKSKHVLALSKDGGTLYRTWLAGFPSRADAVSFCTALKAKSLNCFVKGG